MIQFNRAHKTIATTNESSSLLLLYQEATRISLVVEFDVFRNFRRIRFHVNRKKFFSVAINFMQSLYDEDEPPPLQLSI